LPARHRLRPSQLFLRDFKRLVVPTVLARLSGGSAETTVLPND
jgi:hypothetical protein